MFSCCAQRIGLPATLAPRGRGASRRQFRLLEQPVRRPASGGRRSSSSCSGGGVCRSINSNTQSLSTDVFLQLLDSSGVATQGMPASRILSIAFSSTFRQATPTMASTWPQTMILRTIGVPSETSTL